VTRGRLLQRAGSLGLNGGGAAAAVPPKTACTAQNVSAVEELALSQESQPNTHRSVREIVREMGIRRSSCSTSSSSEEFEEATSARADYHANRLLTRQNAAEDVSGRAGEFYVVY